MAAGHFALLTISYEQMVGGYRVTTTTDTACHKWLRYSWRPPRKHPKAEIVRGLTKMTDTYLCFTVYRDIEQNEAGDTTTHTFNLNIFDTATYSLQWVHFYFWGEIAAVKSPSETCLFIKFYERQYDYYWPAWMSAIGIELPYRGAQSIRPLYAHRVSKVEVMLTHRGVPCTIQLAIHKADASLFPIEPPLAKGFYVFPNTDPGWVWKSPTIHLDTPVLVKTVPFCIVCQGITPGAYNAQWRSYIPGTFPRGNASATPVPPNWRSYPTQDTNFREWGYPEA